MRTKMNSARRFLFAVVGALTLAATGCATSPTNIAARHALAPTGILRVGVYPGNPSSMVRDAKTGKAAGVAFDFGRALAHDLDAPIEIVEFQRDAQVVDALRNGKVDVTVTNASPTRALIVDFTPPIVRVELESLAVAVPKGRDSALPYLSAFAAKVRSDGRLKAMIDRAGLRGETL